MLVKLLLCTFLYFNFMLTKATPKTLDGIITTIQDAKLIAKMIKKITPSLKIYNRQKIALLINNITKKHHLDPKLMIAIIDTESEFDNAKISTTGDVSLAQINLKIWNKEFDRLGQKKLNKVRLRNDTFYALTKMAEILNILKSRYAQKDKLWFARYHSSTEDLKHIYNLKLQSRLNMIASLH